MADDLQALLTRITEEELKKADEQTAQILSAAKAEAEKIREQAQKEADELRAQAQKDARMFEQKGKEALQQASRDVLLALRSELKQRVEQAVTTLMQASCQGNSLSQILTRLLENFLLKNGTEEDLTVLLPANELQQVTKAVQASLAEDLRKHCHFAPQRNLAAGFQLRFSQSGVVYDFSDAALAETLSAHVGPQIADLLK